MRREILFIVFILHNYGCFSFEALGKISFVPVQLNSTPTPPTNICANKQGYIPHENNCSLFYSCENNVAKNGSCPPSMWFDPNYIDEVLCNLPEVVCAADNNVCDCATDYPAPPADPLIEPDIICLKDNQLHLFPSLVSCSRYFICHNENLFRMECRPGFHYNNHTKQCDYPEEVNCKLPDPECPLDGVKFLTHPERCDAFLFCIHGYKTLQTCPFYHYWDQKTNSCRKQDEVKCHLEEDKI